MIYAKIKNSFISIYIEDAERVNKFIVSGTKHIDDKKSFKRYFDNLYDASLYYNKKCNEVTKLALKIK